MKRKKHKLRNTKSHTKKGDELFTGQSEPDFTTQTTKTMYQKATSQLMVNDSHSAMVRYEILLEERN
jgi:hypothetical protein